MTTPYERTKAVTGTRDFLQMLAVAKEVNVPGLVQSVALSLLRHFPLPIDVDVSAAALPGLWAPAVQLRSSSSSGANRTSDVPEDFPCERGRALPWKGSATIFRVSPAGREVEGQISDKRYERWVACEGVAGRVVGLAIEDAVGRSSNWKIGFLQQLCAALVQKGEISVAESGWVVKRASGLLVG
jgi:hypothetical protein